MEDICKVCRLGRFPDRPLFHPCRCTGSIKYVHQDCLMQWLGHSGKERCELCHHRYQFASVYRHDMPKWIPINDIYQSIMQNFISKIGRWLHLGFVVFIWLFLVPIVTYRIYKCMVYSSFWSLLMLPVRIFTMDSLVLDSLLGVVIVVLCLLGFISLVWLKDQLSSGDSPPWLVADREAAKQQMEDAEKHKTESHNKATHSAASLRKFKQNSTERHEINRNLINFETQIESVLYQAQEACLRWHYERSLSLRIREMSLMYDLGMPVVHYQPMLKKAHLKNFAGMDKWKTEILNQLKEDKKLHPRIDGLPSPMIVAINQAPLPSLEELGLNGLDVAVFDLFNRLPCPPPNEVERINMMSELQQTQADLNEQTKIYRDLQKKLTAWASGCILSDSLKPTERSMMQDIKDISELISEKFEEELVLISNDNKEIRSKFPEAFAGSEKWYEKIIGRNNVEREEQLQGRPHGDEQDEEGVVEEDQEERQILRRPNIGHALVGLARDPQDANAEAFQAEQLMRMVGLDGSFRFLEHVLWLTVLVSTMIFIFVYLPLMFGSFIAWSSSLWEKIGIEKWQTSSSILLGYCFILAAIVFLYYLASGLQLYRWKPVLGVFYLSLKICLLLFLEAGIFPLLCGWWIDICAFGLLGSNLKMRKESLSTAPGTLMFLHWLAGMIFVFYFASLVVLLREVLRPGVLWFLRNLNDQNFHPIQDMISQPFQRHVRRFLMSNIMFGVSIMVVILIPSYVTSYLLPGFLPYNLTLISSVSPMKEIQLELILLQFVIPTLLEHSNTRSAIKRVVKYWSTSVAKLLGVQSYLLDGPQTGGDLVDIHGSIIKHINFDPNWEGPVYVGENQTLGPGYAPFKPYLRPVYFGIRITILIFLLVCSVIATSTFFLVGPIFFGRYLMLFVGITSPPDVYTASIGIYVLWIFGRACSFLMLILVQGNVGVLIKQTVFWIVQGSKCVFAGVLLFIVIPLLIGRFVNLLIISPLRVPFHKTPLFYPTTEWALGLLHMKCACGIVWLTDTAFKRTLDILYQNGARNIKLLFIMKEVVLPVVYNLVLCLAIPYIALMGFARYLGFLTTATSYTLYRYCYPFVLLLLISMVMILIVLKQSHNLYAGIRNEKYLIGRQLMNFGTSPTFEVSSLSTPVEESREQ